MAYMNRESSIACFDTYISFTISANFQHVGSRSGSYTYIQLLRIPNFSMLTPSLAFLLNHITKVVNVNVTCVFVHVFISASKVFVFSLLILITNKACSQSRVKRFRDRSQRALHFNVKHLGFACVLSLTMDRSKGRVRRNCQISLLTKAWLILTFIFIPISFQQCHTCISVITIDICSIYN